MSDLPEKDSKNATQNRLELVKNFFKHPITVATISIILTTLFNQFGAVKELNTSVDFLKEDIDEFKNSLSDVEISLSDEFHREISELRTEMNSEIAKLNDDIAELNKTMNPLLYGLRPTILFANAITDTYTYDFHLPYTDEPIQLAASSIIAYTANKPEEEYTVSQLANRPLLLPYTSGAQEVFFYGQLDGDGNWDGHCIVNIYENNQLSLITDAQYDNGNLLNCKQLFPTTTTGGQSVWAISEREVEHGYSSGETQYYLRTQNYEKEFAFDDVRSTDIFSVDSFYSTIDSSLVGYYWGNISDKQFNDDTGNAYMVKYFADGTVRTLYKGKFKNGQFHDDTGTAWMLGKNEMGSDYAYYKGIFINGDATKNPNCWIEPLTLEEIGELVDETAFNCKLVWTIPHI